MKTFAVAHVCLFDNILTIDLINADSILAAIKKHGKLQDEENQKWLDDCPFEGQDDIKEYFFDCDQMIDVIEVPQPGD